MAESDNYAQAELRTWLTSITARGVHQLPSRTLQQILELSANHQSLYSLAYYTTASGIYNTLTGKITVTLDIREPYWQSALSPRQHHNHSVNQQLLPMAVAAIKQPLGEAAEISLVTGMHGYQYEFEWTPEPSPSRLYTDFCCETPEDLQRFQPGMLLWLACPKVQVEPPRPATLLTILRVTAVDANIITGLCQTYTRHLAVTVGIPFLQTFLRGGGLIVGCQIPRRRGQVTFNQGKLWAKKHLWWKCSRNRPRTASAWWFKEQALVWDPRRVSDFGELMPQTPKLEPVEPGLIIRR